MILKNKNISSRHWSLKEKAIEFRKKGLSYQEILTQIPVAKSTISLWCRQIQLTSVQQKRILAKRGNQLKGVKAAQTMFWRKRCEAFDKGVTMSFKLKGSSFFSSGLMLYWAEGSKTNSPAITNSDPEVIKFMALWFKKFFSISSESMVIQLHLHSGQNEIELKKFWSTLIALPGNSFSKSFIKPEGSGYRKNILYLGTAKLRVRGIGSTYLLFTILGGIAGYLQTITGTAPKPEQWISKLTHA